MPWVKNLLSHYEMNIWVVSKLVAFLQLSAFFIKDVRSWNLFLNSIIISLNFRSYQWNCTKSSSIGRDVWPTGKCPRPALVAACTWLCPQSSPWRRCFCGKNLDFSTFFFFWFRFQSVKLDCGVPWQVLDGQKVLPKRAKELGFQFKYPHVQDALKTILWWDERVLIYRCSNCIFVYSFVWGSNLFHHAQCLFKACFIKYIKIIFC